MVKKINDISQLRKRSSLSLAKSVAYLRNKQSDWDIEKSYLKTKISEIREKLSYNQNILVDDIFTLKQQKNKLEEDLIRIIDENQAMQNQAKQDAKTIEELFSARKIQIEEIEGLQRIKKALEKENNAMMANCSAACRDRDYLQTQLSAIYSEKSRSPWERFWHWVFN